MTLIKIVLRKMYKNKGFVLFLLLGLLISSALMSSIPLYTSGVLQKVLVKDMEDFQKNNEIYPGSFSVYTYANDAAANKALVGVDEDGKFKDERTKKHYKEFVDDAFKINNYINSDFQNKMSLPIIGSGVSFATDPKITVHDNFKPGDFDDSCYSRVKTLSNYEKHVKLIDGKFPSKGKTDGIYEVMISVGAQRRLGMALNRVYVMKDPKDKDFPEIKVKPVGVFDQKEDDGIFWSSCKIYDFDESVVMNEEDAFNDIIKSNPTQLDTVKWFISLDYHKLSLGNMGDIYTSYNKITKDLLAIRETAELDFQLKYIVNNYVSKESQLKTTMWSLNVPVMIMLAIYMFMVSNLVINKEKNEIALLISRGASRMQVVFGYLVEGLILGITAFVLGPILGVYLTKALGASSGFLEFVNRKALDVHLNGESFAYSLLANVIFLITLLVPAYKASNTSIVDHKRKLSREKLTAIWQKTYIDIILLAISAYGYYTFSQRKQNLKITGATAGSLQVDPLLFFVPVLFILGMSLLCLRLYPLFLKLVYRAGKKFWPPSMYGTLVQVSRSSVSYHFLMVFIMLTLSVGTFSAIAARTINTNGEEKIQYQDGADITLRPVWEMLVESSGPPAAGAPPASENKKQGSVLPQYIEPPFQMYENLPGVETAAKVYTNNNGTLAFNDVKKEDVGVMAIEPYEYGHVVWYRNGLLPHHINEYLNLLSTEKSACLISEQLSKDAGLKVGDSITLSWGIAPPVVFNVYGIVKYWPTYVPNISNPKGPIDPSYVITNLTYVQDNFPKEPYEVWLKLKQGASRQALYDGIRNTPSTIIAEFTDTKEDLIKLKNDSSQLAINGSLTLGFIISGLICFLGFVLYWVLSLKERSLQFGVLRAIGLSSAQLKFMMIWEQVLTSGVAMIIGTVVGQLCSKFFVEFFRISASYSDQVPPFTVVSYIGDRMKVYGFIGITMILGLGILIYLLSRIKISNVIKLGED